MARISSTARRLARPEEADESAEPARGAGRTARGRRLGRGRSRLRPGHARGRRLQALIELSGWPCPLCIRSALRRGELSAERAGSYQDVGVGDRLPLRTGSLARASAVAGIRASIATHGNLRDAVHPPLRAGTESPRL